MARDIATRRVVDYRSLTDAEVTEMAVDRGYPAPPDRLTAEGLLLLSEPGAENIELSVPDELGEAGRIQMAEQFIQGTKMAERQADAAAKKAAKPKPKPKVKYLGGGYYQAGDEKYRGKAALEAAGYEVP